MPTYADLLRQPIFARLLADQALGTAAQTIQVLALSVLAYERTGSALLAALAIVSGVLLQAVGGALLLGVWSRVDPRGALVLWAALRSAVAVLLATDVLAIIPALGLVAATGLLRPAAVTVQTGLMVEELGERMFTLGRSVLNMTIGLMQIAGFALGGTLLLVAGAHGALMLAVLPLVLSMVILRYGIPHGIKIPREATGVAMTWRANRAMLGNCALRPLLVAQWVPNGLIVAAEAQFVPYAGSAAGVLFVCSAAGMLVGDTIVGRFLSPALQRRAVFPLLVLLAVPYLALAFHPPIAVAAAAVTLASVGYGSTLCLQARMLELVPAARQSQAFGLAYSGTMTGQAAMTLLIGGASDVVGAAGAVGAAAVMSLLVTALLARPIRATAPMTEIGARAFS